MKLSYSQEPYTTLEQSNSMFQEIICSIQESLVKWKKGICYDCIRHGGPSTTSSIIIYVIAFRITRDIINIMTQKIESFLEYC